MSLTPALTRALRATARSRPLVNRNASLQPFAFRPSAALPCSLPSASSCCQRRRVSTAQQPQQQQTAQPAAEQRPPQAQAQPSSSSPSSPSAASTPGSAASSSAPSSASASPAASSPASAADASSPPSPSPSVLAEKEAQIAALDAKQKETYDRLLRAAADLENVRRTSRMDVENSRKFASTAFAKSMLDVADTLELAAKSAREQAGAAGSESGSAAAAVQSLLEGVEMTEKVLLKALAEHGVVKQEAMGQRFSPHEHHALFEVEDEGKEPGTIAHVMKQGYRIHDRVLRAAQVGTVKARK